MKRLNLLRRFLLIVALLVIISSAILLLNFTSGNPTGRRYSSAVPLTTGQGSGADIGLSAETILAKDLGLPRNDSLEQRQCICSTPSARTRSECNVCFASSPLASSFRRPDFVAADFIAESKNRRNLLYTNRDFDQISDYAAVAKAIDVPLWVFIRVNTTIDPEYSEVVESTGGGIIHYFVVPGYQDPVDQAAKVGLVVAIPVFTGIGWWEIRLYRRRRKPVYHPVRVPVEHIDDAEAFVERLRSKSRREVDEENARWGE